MQTIERAVNLFDDGQYTEINSFLSYSQVRTAYGYVNGNPVYAFFQDSKKNGGAISKNDAEKISKLYDMAVKTGTPIIAFYDSDGAFMDGTAECLNSYGKMLSASGVISGVVPQISVIVGACTGMSAMLACSADLVIMTKNAEFYSAPNSKGDSETAEKAGLVSLVCEDEAEAIEKVKTFINILPSNNLCPAPVYEYEETQDSVTGDIKGFVKGVCDANSVIELSAGYGKASYTAFASVKGSTIGICGTNKTSDKLNADDCTKIARFVRMCDAFAIPIVTVVDTEGFEGATDKNAIEEIKAMTRLANCYAEATTVKISVITGKAIGSAFTALAGKNVNADFVFAWENAVIAPVMPETAVEFLWHDELKNADNLQAKRAELAQKYAETLASARSAAAIDAVDDVIAPENTKDVLASALDIMSGKRVSKLPKKHSNIPL